jgi:hypothetical protein
MKYFLKFSALFILVLGMAGTAFVAVARCGTPQPAAVLVKQSAYKGSGRSLKRAGRRRANSRPSVIRVRRLSPRQVRDFYRRMLDIYTN